MAVATGSGKKRSKNNYVTPEMVAESKRKAQATRNRNIQNSTPTPGQSGGMGRFSGVSGGVPAGILNVQKKMGLSRSAPAPRRQTISEAMRNEFDLAADQARGRLNAQAGIRPPNWGPDVSEEEPDNEWTLPTFNKSLADYLRDVQGGSSASAAYSDSDITEQLKALDRARGDMKTSTANGDSQLAAMYGALQRATQTDKAETAARYKQAGKDSAALTTANQNALLNANAKTDNSQNLVAQNLGLADDPNIHGPRAAEKTQNEYSDIANAGVQAMGNLAGQGIIADGLVQQDYGTKMGTAAQFAGTGRRAQLQQALQKGLADIGMSEAELRDSSVQRWQQGQADAQSNALNMAKSLYDADYGQFRDSTGLAVDRDDAAWKRAFDERKLNLDNAPQAPKPGDLGDADAVWSSLETGGVPVESRQRISRVIQDGIGTAGVNEKTGIKISNFRSIYNKILEAVDAGTLTSQEANQALHAAQNIYGQN